MPLDVAAAERAFEVHVCAPLGATVTDAAVAVHEIVNAAMGAAIHVVTVQRGIDPRDFVLVALGGAGPMHAAAIAERFDIDTVLVPAKAGVGSAVGLLGAELSTERARTMFHADPAALDKALRELAGSAAADLSLDPTDPSVVISHSVGVRYRGQSFEMAVPIDVPVDDAAVAAAVERFYAAYRDAFTIDLRDAVEVVSARARLSVPRTLQPFQGQRLKRLQSSGRGVWFDGQYVDTPVWRREALMGEQAGGPLIIEDDEATVVVPPGWRAAIDGRATVTMTRA
jgi:N-methylhydantoinase A